jgi:UDP-3-O-[3-hydroxymyristoyl] glucosamine N-acyltransferase
MPSSSMNTSIRTEDFAMWAAGGGVGVGVGVGAVVGVGVAVGAGDGLGEAVGDGVEVGKEVGVMVGVWVARAALVGGDVGLGAAVDAPHPAIAKTKGIATR